MDIQSFLAVMAFFTIACFVMNTISRVSPNKGRQLDETTLQKLSDGLNEKAMAEWDQVFYAKYPQMKPMFEVDSSLYDKYRSVGTYSLKNKETPEMEPGVYALVQCKGKSENAFWHKE